MTFRCPLCGHTLNVTGRGQLELRIPHHTRHSTPPDTCELADATIPATEALQQGWLT